MDFRPLSTVEREQLATALRRNAGDGAALLTDRKDTSFAGSADKVPDEEVITAIRSVPCHYSYDDAIRLAVELLRGNDAYIQDAREGARVGNSVVGSLLSLPPHSIPRQYAERAVLSALAILDSSAAESIEADRGGNFTLPRSGKAPLRFQGELVAEADGSRQAGREQARWHELTVYQTAGGKYIVRISYATRFQGDIEHDLAEVCDTAAAAAAVLAGYPVEKYVRGFPPHAAYEERQQRLLKDIRRRYDALVADVLKDLPEAAEEVA